MTIDLITVEYSMRWDRIAEHYVFFRFDDLFHISHLNLTCRTDYLSLGGPYANGEGPLRNYFEKVCKVLYGKRIKPKFFKNSNFKINIIVSRPSPLPQFEATCLLMTFC